MGVCPDRFPERSGRHRNLAEGGFAVRHAALHDRFCEIDGQSGQPRYRTSGSGSFSSDTIPSPE